MVSAMAKRTFEEVVTEDCLAESSEHDAVIHTEALPSLFSNDAGPQNLQQLWFWPVVAISRVIDVQETFPRAKLFAELRRKFEVGVELSTAYSGLGSAETAFSFIKEALERKSKGFPCEGTVVSACDFFAEISVQVFRIPCKIPSVHFH